MMAAVINVALSHALVKKMPSPVSVPDLEISGGGRSSRSLDKGGPVSKKKFSALWASLWSKTKRWGGPSGPLPWIRHFALQAIYRSFEGS